MKRLLLSLLLAAPALAQPLPAPVPTAFTMPAAQQLEGTSLRRYAAAEADQGVAVDERHFYAIDNSAIGKYRRDTGALVARWASPRGGLVAHINSCTALDGTLVCANSNYPAIPMGSSVERIDTATMLPAESHSLGLMDEGSLVWLVPQPQGWLAGFAHYDRADGKGGVGYKDARYGNVVRLDAQFRRTGGWLFPEAVLARMKPHAASGGALGPDGLLYVLGHDRPELYVLAQPLMGPVLVHVATIAIEAPGQAFAFVPGSRDIMAISREAQQVVQISLPPVALAPVAGLARPFPPGR